MQPVTEALHWPPTKHGERSSNRQAQRLGLPRWPTGPATRYTILEEAKAASSYVILGHPSLSPRYPGAPRAAGATPPPAEPSLSSIPFSLPGHQLTQAQVHRKHPPLQRVIGNSFTARWRGLRLFPPTLLIGIIGLLGSFLVSHVPRTRPAEQSLAKSGSSEEHGTMSRYQASGSASEKLAWHWLSCTVSLH